MSSSEISSPSSTAERFAALIRVGTALMSELDETRLLTLIAETACDLCSAKFAAFTLRPVDEEGRPLVPSEGNLFHLAAVVGATQEQEALFRRMPLGGEGLLAPIFRHGVAVIVSDALAHIAHPEHHSPTTDLRETAREAAFAYAYGLLSSGELHSLGVPRGHPVVRSFLGAPLLDRAGQVRGGLLLGHPDPDQFTQEDKELLVGLAAQAAVALENARLYRAAQMRPKELDAIFESITDGVIVIDQEKRILRENGTARRLRELLKETSKGKHAVEVLLNETTRRALSGEAVQDITVNLDNGHSEIREYLVSASPLHPPAPSGPLQLEKGNDDDGQQAVAGAVVVWHDVTEARRLLLEQREHAETEARRAQLQLILDELPSGVYLVRGHDARLVLANRATATVWGATWPPGQPMREFLNANRIRIFGVDGHLLHFEQLATTRAIRKGETARQHQEIIRHPDGTTLPVLVNAVALDTSYLEVSPSGTRLQPGKQWEPLALVVLQDVTAIKEAERLKDEFIEIVVHELRTPIAVLKGFAQTLLFHTARGRGPDLAEWQREALQEIDLATLRLVKLADDLFDLTRLQAGRLALHREPTDLVALAQRMSSRLQMTTTNHMLSIHPTVSSLVAHVDAGRIEQVLSNLISNAIKYSPQGGLIEVTIREDDETHDAVLGIRDHGIGIPAEQQAQIFGRFVRADNARESGIGGTGLGLYLCRELVKWHGGRIWFESIEGEGSTFFIALPTTSNGPLPDI